jgi:hypothetical protein
MTALINEDALGNLTGSVTGPTTSRRSPQVARRPEDSIAFAQLFTAYGLRNSLSVSSTGSVVCADGSTGTVMSGKFQRKDFYGSGSGTFSLDNCPVHQQASLCVAASVTPVSADDLSAASMSVKPTPAP